MKKDCGNVRDKDEVQIGGRNMCTASDSWDPVRDTPIGEIVVYIHQSALGKYA